METAPQFTVSGDPYRQGLPVAPGSTGPLPRPGPSSGAPSTRPAHGRPLLGLRVPLVLRAVRRSTHTHTHTHTHMYSRVTAQDPSSAFSWVNLCLTRRSLFHCMRPGNRKVADRPLPQSVPPREAPQPHPSPPAGAQSWQTGKGLGHWRDDVPPRPGGGTGPTPGPSCPSLLTARSRHPATPGATLPKLACPRRSDQAHLGLAQADLGLSPLGTRCRVFTGSVHPDDGQSSTVRPGVTGLV